MKEKLMKILQDVNPDIDFETETGLIDNGILDSFDLVSLVGAIDEEFDIEISFDDIEPENFNSAEAILELIRKLEME